MIAEMVSILELTLTFMREQVADLSDEEMVLQPTGAPNHPAWTLGHIIYSCQAIAVELGMDIPLADWESHYGYGSLPSPLRAESSSKSTLLAALADAVDRLRVALQAIDASTLAKPSADEKMREVLPTMAHTLLQVVVAHTAFHAGQLAAWRRAIGRAPVGVFV